MEMSSLYGNVTGELGKDWTLLQKVPVWPQKLKAE